MGDGRQAVGGKRTGTIGPILTIVGGAIGQLGTGRVCVLRVVFIQRSI